MGNGGALDAAHQFDILPSIAMFELFTRQNYSGSQKKDILLIFQLFKASYGETFPPLWALFPPNPAHYVKFLVGLLFPANRPQCFQMAPLFFVNDRRIHVAGATLMILDTYPIPTKSMATIHAAPLDLLKGPWAAKCPQQSFQK